MEVFGRAGHLGRKILVGSCIAVLAVALWLAWRYASFRTVLPDEPVQVESFADLFSGTAWIDAARTTLPHDPVITAFTDMPRVVVDATSSSAFEASLRVFRERNSCLRGRCLVATSSSLVLDGLPISPPRPDGVVTDIVASVIEDRWLLGLTVVGGGTYELHAYWFDGASFLPALGRGESRVLESRYLGRAAFAGVARHWLAVWSAYEGALVEVRDGAAHDRSSLVGIRAMRGGYAPVLFHDAARHAWYLWSEGAEAPSFIQFAEDEHGAVLVARDLTALIAAGARRLRLAPLAEEGGDGVRFITVMEKELLGGGWGMSQFATVDIRPAPVSREYRIVSANLKPGSRIWRARFAPLGDVVPANSQTEFSLSVDGARWRTATPGEWVVFDGRVSKGIWWQVEIKGGAPVFFDGIHLDFEVGQGT